MVQTFFATRSIWRIFWRYHLKHLITFLAKSLIGWSLYLSKNPSCKKTNRGPTPSWLLSSIRKSWVRCFSTRIKPMEIVTGSGMLYYAMHKQSTFKVRPHQTSSSNAQPYIWQVYVYPKNCKGQNLDCKQRSTLLWNLMSFMYIMYPMSFYAFLFFYVQYAINIYQYVLFLLLNSSLSLWFIAIF